MEEGDTAATETAGAPKPGAHEATELVSRRVRHGRLSPLLRGLMLLVYLAVAWPLVLNSGNTGGFPEDLVVGVLVAALLLMVVAAVALTLRRRRYRKDPARSVAAKPKFTDMLISVPVVLVALVLAGLSAGGRQIQAQQQRTRLAASDAVSNNPEDRDRGALAAWMTSIPAGQQEKALAIHQLALLKSALRAPTLNLPKLVSYAQVANQHADAFVAAVGTEPAATSDVTTVKALHLQEARLFLAATSDYLRGLRRRDPKLLTAGDGLLQRSYKFAQQSARRGEALYHRLGGYQAFGSRIDFQAYASAIQQAQQAAKP